MKNLKLNILEQAYKLFFFLIYLPLSAQNILSDDPNIRVQIINDADSLNISFNENWHVLGSEKVFSPKDGVLKIKIENNQLAFFKCNKVVYSFAGKLILKSSSGTLNIADVPYGVGWWWEGKETRVYEGEINLYRNPDNKIQVVVNLPLEQYLKGVVPYEIGGDSPLEALKVQAVAARSEAVVALQSELYSGPNHDLTSDVECQVFSGNHKRTLNSDKAVELTAGLVISENNRAINAYYSSNCGGHSELIKNVWPQRADPKTYRIASDDKQERRLLDLGDNENAKDWIFSQPAVYCNPNLNTELPSWSKKNFRWKITQKKESISRMLSQGKNLGLVLDIKALKRGKSGRIYSARFVFEKDSFDVQGELNIRQLWQPALRSSCFIASKTDSMFVLNGAGWGHGVGMCQSGAVAQAREGRDFISILKHYYPKTKLIISPAKP